MTEANLPESTMNVTVAEEIVANAASRGLVPGFGGRISAALVWDGTDEVRVPPSMGQPRSDQMRGTARERLVELAGRCCYDSLGKGRSSEDYVKHLLDVGHLSVLEHACATVELRFPSSADAQKFANFCLNRPSMWVERKLVEGDEGVRLRITLNLRHVMEWIANVRGPGILPSGVLGVLIQVVVLPLAPSILGRSDVVAWHNSGKPLSGYMADFGIESCARVDPETDEEKWVTLYLTGSRGWSHECVRHGDWTAISQRSTRYVDESESQWVLHPLIAAFENDPSNKIQSHLYLSLGMRGLHEIARALYDEIVTELQEWLLKRGVDKVSARKQARGAARGLLGNALETEVIFSASVAQWRHMLSMRAADAADAEIRLGFAEAVLPCLRASRYGDRFQDFELVAAGDGIGRSLRGGGHR